MGTSSTVSVCRPAISALRKAVPIPKATTSARSDSGRAISGRIGMSFASTVSRVIDVPPTHSSGVMDSWPAWTDAISSSRDSNIVPPRSSMRASLGWATRPGRVPITTISNAATAPAAATAMRRGRTQNASPTPSAAFISASTTMIAGEPMVGIRTNGMTRLPRIAPVVLTPSRSPDSDPA